AQVILLGYGANYLWPHSSFFNKFGFYLAGAIPGISTALFTKFFLATKTTLPKTDKILIICVFLHVVSIFLALINLNKTSFHLINITSLVGSIVVIASSVKLTLSGYQPAKFYTIAYTFFLLSVVGYIFLSFGALPYNLFTSNILLIGSTVEI